MSTSLLTLTVRTKRELLLARQQARQVARLMGLSPHEQIWLPAAVFDMAQRAWRDGGRAVIEFQWLGDSLHVSAYPGEGAGPAAGLCHNDSEHGDVTRLTVHLLGKSPLLPSEDLTWVIGQLSEVTPASLFDEFKQQNQELLHTINQLRECQAELEQLRSSQSRPAAA